MRIAMIASSCGLAVWAAGAAVAQAGTFQYAVKNLPADSGDCHELARTLGDTVKAQTGVSIRRAICTGADELNYDLLVEYTADQELNLVTTAGTEALPERRGGIHATLQECRAALPAEVERFKSATQLTPVVAYCMFDVFSDTPYAMKVDAFGQAVAAPRFAEWRFFGSPIGTSGAALTATIRAGLLANGIDMSYVAYRDATFDGTIVASYYGATATTARSFTVGYADTQEQCLRAVGDAQSAFAGSNSQGVLATMCSYDSLLEVFNIATFAVNAEALTVTPAIERFASADACYAEIAALTQRYRDEIGRPVVASVCAKARDERWAVMLYEVQASR